MERPSRSKIYREMMKLQKEQKQAINDTIPKMPIHKRIISKSEKTQEDRE